MAAYTTITGEVLADIRVIDGKIYNLADYKNNNRVSNGELTLTNLGSDFKISNPTITIRCPLSSGKTNISIHRTKNNILLGKTFTFAFWARDTIKNQGRDYSFCGCGVCTTNMDFSYSESDSFTDMSIRADHSEESGRTEYNEWYHIMNKINGTRRDPINNGDYFIKGSTVYCLNQWCYYTIMVENGTTYRFYRNGELLGERTSNVNLWEKFYKIYLGVPSTTETVYYDDIILINQLIFPVNGFTPPTDYVTGPYTGTLHNRMCLSPYQTIYDDRAILY